MTPTDEAYAYLPARMDDGADFPTAHERTVLRFDLSDTQSRRLIARYDEHDRWAAIDAHARRPFASWTRTTGSIQPPALKNRSTE
jgi:hypothetical protein